MTVLDTLKQLVDLVTVDRVIYTVGIALFATWLLRTSLGRRSLVDAPPRHNSMAPLTPFIPFFVWFLGFALIKSVLDRFIDPAPGAATTFYENAVFGTGALLTVFGLILPLAHVHFARGLKGFGLNLRSIPRDLVASVVHLLTVWPIMGAMFIATTIIGQLVKGPDFEMPVHQTLEAVTEHAGLGLQVLLALVAVAVAPLIEETIFRGLFQTTIRSYLGRPWLAIIVTAALFTSVHENLAHWPALFVLALGMGYSYEKSGSLWRPIFMHAIFNGISVAAVLSE
jgi:membrane protease YdiL (CAAX protease family)